MNQVCVTFEFVNSMVPFACNYMQMRQNVNDAVTEADLYLTPRFQGPTWVWV